MIFVDGKGQSFQWRLNYNWNRFNKEIKKGNFKKDLINLIETNQQINMTCDHSVSSNGTFKSHLNARVLTQPAFTCSKLIIETLEQGVKYVQS